MEYSAVDVAAALTLQRLTYLYVSITTFWIYDYASSLHEELKFLRQSRWTKVKVLYITTRYLPFLLLSMYIYLNLTPENPNKCKILINIYSFFLCSEHVPSGTTIGSYL